MRQCHDVGTAPARSSTVSRFRAADRADAEGSQIAGQLVSLLAPTSYEADQYRSLRHIIESLHKQSGVQVLAITSPGPGDGKTVTTLNLAGALAQSREARVLLVDADLRRPAVAEYLGLGRQGLPGLADAMADPLYGLAETVRRLDWANLSVLPAGHARTGVYELLNSPRLETLLGDARRIYDYVLIDTPPAALSDCRLVGKWVDGFLIIVAANKTPRKLLVEALNLLEPSKVIGMVFNGADRTDSAYYGYCGYYTSGPASASDANVGWWRRVWRSARRVHG